MKSITILLVLMILLTSQSLSAQAKIGITAGASFANVTAKFQGITISPKTKVGFTGGLFADVPLSADFSFQPALNFVQKGYKSSDEFSSEKLSYNYLEIPLNFIYDNKGFFIGAGPSIAFGLSGKDKYVDKTDPSLSEDTKIEFGSKEEQVKRAEFGANILAGYKIEGGLMFTVNYNQGLNNIANSDPDEEGTIKNRHFAVKIGYAFGGGKHSK